MHVYGTVVCSILFHAQKKRRCAAYGVPRAPSPWQHAWTGGAMSQVPLNNLTIDSTCVGNKRTRSCWGKSSLELEHGEIMWILIVFSLQGKPLKSCASLATLQRGTQHQPHHLCSTRSIPLWLDPERWITRLWIRQQESLWRVGTCRPTVRWRWPSLIQPFSPSPTVPSSRWSTLCWYVSVWDAVYLRFSKV